MMSSCMYIFPCSALYKAKFKEIIEISYNTLLFAIVYCGKLMK